MAAGRSRSAHTETTTEQLPSLDPANDPVMLCGSPHLLADVQEVLAERKFAEGNHSTPGHFVIETAFVER